MIHLLFAMPYQPSIAIANEFLRRAKVEARPLTHMHLQKLVYLAHGWTLAVSGRPLIEEQFQAWDYGPVVRPLYNALRYCGSGPVPKLINFGDGTRSALDDAGEARAELEPDEKAVIDQVWETYKEFEAFQLSALTHADSSPWDVTYRENGQSAFIDNNRIWDYFADLAARDG
jgi:uncharacterized phage-associated protein